jgi:hypothetical protein
MMNGQRFPIAISSKVLSYGLAGLLAVTGIASAQESSEQPHPWRRAADVPSEQAPPPADQAGPNQGSPDQPPPPPRFSANQQGNPGYGQQPGPGAGQPYPMQQPYPTQQAYPMQQPYPAQRNQQQGPPPQRNYNVPATLTIRPGTYVTVHVNQWLSSDRNQQGDAFFASLAEPLVVDGVVVAQRGQTVQGRITQAQKAGRVEGTSKLGVELTSLTLVDGTQVNIHSQMVTRNGQTSLGRDAGGIAGTTALGAAIGAGADWGRGAAIGAGAGAAAGILGVLLTRGRPTEISPESMLTFQMEAPVTVATDRAPQAFRYAEGGDYGRGYSYSQDAGPRQAGPRPAYYPPASGPYYGGYYGGYYGPGYYPYYGSGVSIFVGPRFGYGYYGSRGFRR